MTGSLKEFVEERLNALGLNAFEAARDGDLNRQFIHDILIGKKRSVLGENVNKMARALATTPESIIAAASTRAPAGRPAPRIAPPAPKAATGQMQRDLPVLGTAAGAVVAQAARRGAANTGFSLDRQRILGHVWRPPALAGNRDAYALYVVDGSMVPMHNPGELRLVDPLKPPRPADSVIVLQRAGEGLPIHAFIKLFVGRDEHNDVLARQISPEATMRFTHDTIVDVHRVLTMNEILEG